MDDWVTLATFNHPFEAQPLKGLLESEGIRCYLTNENLVAVNPLYANAVGGVELRVPSEEHERARRILLRPVDDEDLKSSED